MDQGARESPAGNLTGIRERADSSRTYHDLNRRLGARRRSAENGDDGSDGDQRQHDDLRNGRS